MCPNVKNINRCYENALISCKANVKHLGINVMITLYKLFLLTFLRSRGLQYQRSKVMSGFLEIFQQTLWMSIP